MKERDPIKNYMKKGVDPAMLPQYCSSPSHSKWAMKTDTWSCAEEVDWAGTTCLILFYGTIYNYQRSNRSGHNGDYLENN